MKFIDEIASLSTATLFAFTVLIFTSTGRAVGSQVTNRMLLLLALIYLAILNIILFREPLLFSAGGFRWLWLTLSGIIGLSLGHAAFQGEAASTLRCTKCEANHASWACLRLGRSWDPSWEYPSRCWQFSTPKLTWLALSYYRQKTIHFSIEIPAKI